MKHRILTTGSDQGLVQSRALILGRQYESKVVSPDGVPGELRQESYSLLLICHSIAQDRATELIRAVRAEFPRLWIVRLLAVDSPLMENAGADRTVVANHHPEKWLQAIEELLARPTGGERSSAMQAGSGRAAMMIV